MIIIRNCSVVECTKSRLLDPFHYCCFVDINLMSKPINTRPESLFMIGKEGQYCNTWKYPPTKANICNEEKNIITTMNI